MILFISWSEYLRCKTKPRENKVSKLETREPVTRVSYPSILPEFLARGFVRVLSEKDWDTAYGLMGTEK